MSKKLIILSLISCLVFFLASDVNAIDTGRKLREIQAKSKDIKRKIEETRRREQAAIGKLTTIQRKLYATQDLLRRNKFKLSSTQNNLKLTEDKLVELKQDYSGLKIDAEDRIRQIYQGQRLRIIENLLKVPDLTNLLDVLYYQKCLVAQDKELLEKLFKQSEEIESIKEQLADQKIKIANIVGKIEGQKKIIANEHSNQSRLVEKLRTERRTYEQAERQLERDSDQLIADINRLMGKGSFSGSFLPGTGRFAYPLAGRLTSPFGRRVHPIFKVISFHSGVDLAAPHGTPIMASDSGRVIFDGWYGGYGKVVIVDHGRDYSTLYAHLSRTSVSKGRSVKQGDIVGYEGQTGYSTGPHLHFEVRKSGRPQNPLNYLR